MVNGCPRATSPWIELGKFSCLNIQKIYPSFHSTYVSSAVTSISSQTPSPARRGDCRYPVSYDMHHRRIHIVHVSGGPEYVEPTTNIGGWTMVECVVLLRGRCKNGVSFMGHNELSYIIGTHTCSHRFTCWWGGGRLTT